MESTRSVSPVSSVCSEPIWLGVGSAKPRPRVKNTGMFGYVSDAFDGKSVNIGQLPAYAKSKKEETSGNDICAGTARKNGTDGSKENEVRIQTSEMSAENDDTENVIKNADDNVLATANDAAQGVKSDCVLIKGALVVNEDKSFKSDIYVEEGKIKLMGIDLCVPEDVQMIDATNRLVLPGGIDSTFLRKPFLNTRSVDDFESGTKAALAGGTTCIMNYVTADENETLVDVFDQWMAEAKETACCDYIFHVCVRQWNDDVMEDMKTLTQQRGVNSFHVSMSDLKDTSDLYQFFKHCRSLGAVAMVTAENQLLVDELTSDLIKQGITGPEGCLLSHTQEGECDALTRAIMTANEANAPLYITSLTSKTSADIVARARKRGKMVFSEVSVASLALESEQYFDKSWSHAAGFVMNPPLRSSSRLPLIQLLSGGDAQLISSNHSTFTVEQRALGRNDFRLIPYGVNGAEERMSVLWHAAVSSGEMDPCRFVAVTSTLPAKLFNIYPQKGTIAVGSDADLVIWDPENTTTFSVDKQKSKSDFNIYDGMTFTGQPVIVIQSGKVVVDNGEVSSAPGQGQYVSTSCFGEYVYSRLLTKEKIEKPQPVERDPFDVELFKSTAGDGGGDSGQDETTTTKEEHIYHRPLTSCGTRNLHDSSFSISGMSDGPKVIESVYVKRTCGTKISQPPGGSTTTRLW